MEPAGPSFHTGTAGDRRLHVHVDTEDSENRTGRKGSSLEIEIEQVSGPDIEGGRAIHVPSGSRHRDVAYVERFAPEVGEKATPRTLRKPEVNLRIGARYMAWLWERLNENPALVPAAYNAGEGAVRRWLVEDSERPLDIFIEEIPYDETRRYTRRVLQTYGVYQWLADEQLPKLRTRLPGTAAPQRYSALN